MSLSRSVVAAALLASAPALAHAQSRPINRANLDTACAACQDFYSFANGGWLKRTPIPPAYSNYGSFNEVGDRNEALLRSAVEDDAAAVANGSAKRGSNEWKVGTFYSACMDTTRIASLGLTPLQPTYDVIDRIHSTSDLTNSLGTLARMGAGGVFGFGPGPDAKNSQEIIANVGQGGLGLPEREYYFRTDARSQSMRDAYVAHIERTLVLSGETADKAKADAQMIMSLETKLAQLSMSRVDMRDPNATYHKMQLADVQQIMTHVDLGRYLSQVGAGHVTTVNVGQPVFLKGADSLLAAVPVEDWKTYFRWHATNNALGTLSAPYEAEAFRWAQVSSGATEQLPRARRCVAVTNAALGEVLSQEYIRRNFSPAAKARAVKMVENLQAALREQVKQLPWMSEVTKVQALEKLDAYVRKVAYPDTWRDYSKLQVTPGAYADNIRAAREFTREIAWGKLGKPVDRAEWGMSATIVNASYSPSQNGVTLPAGILQPPFFDPAADDAVNYGGIAAAIGHEMTHGFDDQGRQFDAKGNLRDWWTADDATKYNAQAQLVVDQFNSYTVVDSATHVNGKLTLGENIADLGGLKIAYIAMEKAMAQNGRPANIDGFTPEQRFFLSWAQIWRRNIRPEAARTQVNTDVHSPAKWRVNGPLSNMPEFKAAWGCSAGDAMVRADNLRARIW